VPGGKTRFRLIVWLILAAALGWAGAHYVPVRRLFNRKPEALNLFTAHIPAPAPEVPTPFGHPYYPYSVIPGGAHSRDELEKALAGDSTAAKHYSDFVVQNTRIVTLDKDRQYHVSYRIGDKIYWTSRVLTLRKGEQLLFDGVHYARARCGNRLSEVLTKPLLAQSEPNPKKFEAPVPIEMSLTMQVPHLDPGPELRFEVSMTRIEGLPEPLSNLAAPYVPEAPESVDYVPTRHDRATLFAFDGPGPLSMLPIFYPTETPSSAAVPEPGTGALEALALLGIGAIVWTRKYRRDRMTRRSN
jgi:hypothetical protein